MTVSRKLNVTRTHRTRRLGTETTLKYVFTNSNKTVFTPPSENFLYIKGKLTKKWNDRWAVRGIGEQRDCVTIRNGQLRNGRCGGRPYEKRSQLNLYCRSTNATSRRCSTQGMGGAATSYVDRELRGRFQIFLSMKLLRFSEDYVRIVMNVKQELIPFRTSVDSQTITLTNKSEANRKPELTNVYWKLPYLNVANVYR